MRFSSLSSADKIKAGGLAGLIVIALFFVVHTMLGVVSPPRASSDGPAAQAEGATASEPVAASPTAPAAPEARNVGVVPASVAAGGKQVSGLGIAGLDMHDPFIPIRDANKPFVAPPNAHPADTAPAISVQSPLPMPGGGGGDVGYPSVGPVTPQAPPPAPEPDIRLVGFVHGDTAVATLQIDGRTALCRPGDVVAAGYRLVGVSPEAIHIRHGHTLITLRTGEALHRSGGAVPSTAAQPK